MKFSENGKKIFECLKANHGTNMTAADVAEATGLDAKVVNGSFNAFVKNGVGVRVEGEGIGTKEVSFLGLTGATPEDGVELSENAQKIMAYLGEMNGQYVTLDDVATALELDKRVVNGAFNGLVKKGLCARTPKTVEVPAVIKYLTLTDEGLACDPNAAE